jgi:hypothetical protein
MAIINPKTAFENEQIQRFGGIDKTGRVSESSACSVVNFRVMKDGSLEKRSGYVPVIGNMNGARGSWEGELNGNYYAFLVCKNRVLYTRYGLNDFLQCHILTTTVGDVSFVLYKETLYLLDGAKVLRFYPNTNDFEVAMGYIPLYGRNWHPNQMGEVLERPNVFCNKLRVHYLNTGGYSTFRFPYEMKSVDCVRLDGRMVTNYTYNVSDGVVNIGEANSATHVEIAATLATAFSQESMVSTSTNATVYRDAYHETLFLTGASVGHQLYASAEVTDDMLAASKNMYYQSTPIYLPDNRVFTVGSNTHPITAFCQTHNQLLVFNEQSIWAIRHPSINSDELQIYTLGSDVGCSIPKGALLCNNTPVVIWREGIYALHLDRSDPNIYDTEKLSEDIDGVISDTDPSLWFIFWDPDQRELWLRNRSDTSGTNWIYSLERKNWVIFQHIHSQMMFHISKSICFIDTGGILCAMSKEIYTDDGVPIRTVYKSHYLSFSNPEFCKRSLRMSTCLDAPNAALTVQLTTERESRTFNFHLSSESAPAMLDCKLAVGRFRFLQYEISEVGSHPVRIHFLSLSANL